MQQHLSDFGCINKKGIQIQFHISTSKKQRYFL